MDALEWRGARPVSLRQANLGAEAAHVWSRASVTGSRDFVGRHAEVARFARVGNAVLRAHRPAALIVVGDPGAGKRRLLNEGVEWSGIARRVHLTGFEIERTVPLAGARALLAQAAASAPGDAVRTLLYSETHESNSPSGSRPG